LGGDSGFRFTLIHWAIGSQHQLGGARVGFFTDLYYSGTTFCTLGLGDLTPITSAARVITVLEASMGLGLLAWSLVTSGSYQLSRGAKQTSRCWTRARGTPPTAFELLRRHQEATVLKPSNDCCAIGRDGRLT